VGEKKRTRPPPEAVRFRRPPPAVPRVAIIGGGVAGLTCASRLEARGATAVVYDTGKHAPGGRMGSRVMEIPGWGSSTTLFDHAAQYIPVSASRSDPRFVAMAAAWVEQNRATVWDPDGLVHLSLEAGPSSGEGGAARPAVVERRRLLGEGDDDTEALVGVGGMRALAWHLAAGLDLRGDTWVDVLKYQRGGAAREATPEGWLVGRKGQPLDVFDAVVIAHNGKCADRLLRRTGAALATQAMKKLRLSSMWVCLVAFSGPVGADFEAAEVEGSILRFAANQTAKGVAKGEGECWTLISTEAYGKKNKVPQEAVPPEKSEQVYEELLDAFLQAVGVDRDGAGVDVVAWRCQLWGAALGTNSPRTSAVWCPESRVGIAGDWLHLGSIEGAAVSGLDLADAIVDFSEAASDLRQGGWREAARTLGRAETRRPYARVTTAGILEEGRT